MRSALLAIALAASMLGVVGCASPPHFPTRESAGLPAGWSPAREVTGDLWLQTDGEVVEDLRVAGGTIFVDATDITLRRIQGVGARVSNLPGSACGTGLLIEDSTFLRGDLGAGSGGEAVVGLGGYTLRNTVIDGAPEGLRVAAKDSCGRVVVEDSFVRVLPPDSCDDWHGDGIQGYDGGELVVRNTVIEFVEAGGCGGTAAFFYPDGQGNTSVDIDRLVVSGGGFPFRLGMPGSVTGLGVVEGSWAYAPVDVTSCSELASWEAEIVRLDTAGQPVPVGSIECG